MKTSRDPQSKKFVRLLNEMDNSVHNSPLDGFLTFDKVRKKDYSVCVALEVDISFSGKIFFSYLRGHNWYESQVQTEDAFSKIKFNRFLKQFLFEIVQSKVHLLSGKNLLVVIKKVSWT